jgi:hypothetical protein
MSVGVLQSQVPESCVHAVYTVLRPIWHLPLGRLNILIRIIIDIITRQNRRLASSIFRITGQPQAAAIESPPRPGPR